MWTSVEPLSHGLWDPNGVPSYSPKWRASLEIRIRCPLGCLTASLISGILRGVGGLVLAEGNRRSMRSAAN